MDKNQNTNQDVNFEQIDFEKLENLEEVVTPGAGSAACCVS